MSIEKSFNRTDEIYIPIHEDIEDEIRIIVYDENIQELNSESNKTKSIWNNRFISTSFQLLKSVKGLSKFLGYEKISETTKTVKISTLTFIRSSKIC